MYIYRYMACMFAHWVQPKTTEQSVTDVFVCFATQRRLLPLPHAASESHCHRWPNFPARFRCS